MAKEYWSFNRGALNGVLPTVFLVAALRFKPRHGQQAPIFSPELHIAVPSPKGKLLREAVQCKEADKGSQLGDNGHLSSLCRDLQHNFEQQEQES